MRGVYTIVIERDEEGWFVGHAPALPGCHTQARSIDQLMERMEEAVTLWLEVEKDNEPSTMEMVGIQRLAV